MYKGHPVKEQYDVVHDLGYLLLDIGQPHLVQREGPLLGQRE